MILGEVVLYILAKLSKAKFNRVKQVYRNMQLHVW